MIIETGTVRELREGDVLDTTDGAVHSYTGHVVGRVYWCRYWQKAYIVLGICHLWGTCTGVSCLWEDDEITHHCTRLTLDGPEWRRDVELREVS